jgi:dipeptide/tripeptide permease
MCIYYRQLRGCSELTPEGTLSLLCIVCDDIPLASSMNVLWQIPQFMLIGTSEILAAVTAMEFFYSEVCDARVIKQWLFSGITSLAMYRNIRHECISLE